MTNKDRLKMCIAEAGYDPEAVIGTEDDPKVVVWHRDDVPTVPNAVVSKALEVCGLRRPIRRMLA